jgi:hypothetical protein
MGRKNQIPQFYAITDGDLSADIAGLKSVVGQTDRAFYIAEVAGTDIAGELKIEVSEDDIVWTELPISPDINLSNANLSAIVQISEITWKFMRPRYIDLSTGVAVGTLNVRMTATTQGA